MKILNFLFILFSAFSHLYGTEQNVLLDEITNLIPEIKNCSQCSLQKIGGGLTNVNYKVDFNSNHYFIRSSYSQNHLLDVSLDREWKCTSKASAKGLAPKIISYFPEKNLMVTEFIETDGKPIDLKNVSIMKKFCELVKNLHQLEEEFPSQFCPFDSIQFYKTNALKAEACLPSCLIHVVLPQILELKEKFQRSMKVVPCHLDLHSGNVLNDGNKLWLIDWEYAAMGDPLFDLATAASVDNFSDSQMFQLLDFYFGNESYALDDFIYFYYMRVLADIRWALWCYLQVKISSIDGPYQDLGNEFLTHGMERLFVLYSLHCASTSN